jgi:AcrR family transcriptional regulator
MRAAARVFRQRGFAAAGMRDIAVAADLSAANLYHYFRGKDELLFFCQDRALDRLLRALDAARRDRRPLAARLRDLAAAHVRCLLDEVEGSAAHLAVDALPPRLRARIVAKRDRYERGIRALVTAGIRSRSLRAADATIATRAFLGALNWTAHWFRPEGGRAPQEIAQVVADYAVAGLAAAALPIDPRANRTQLPGQFHPPHDEDGPRAHHGDRERRSDRSRVRAVQNAARGSA